MCINTHKQPPKHEKYAEPHVCSGKTYISTHTDTLLHLHSAVTSGLWHNGLLVESITITSTLSVLLFVLICASLCFFAVEFISHFFVDIFLVGVSVT